VTKENLQQHGIELDVLIPTLKSRVVEILEEVPGAGVQFVLGVLHEETEIPKKDLKIFLCEWRKESKKVNKDKQLCLPYVPQSGYNKMGFKYVVIFYDPDGTASEEAEFLYLDDARKSYDLYTLTEGGLSAKLIQVSKDGTQTHILYDSYNQD
jgi:hypothetical protein